MMYACEKVADLIERDDRLRRQVLQIREQLYGTGVGIKNPGGGVLPPPFH